VLLPRPYSSGICRFAWPWHAFAGFDGKNPFDSRHGLRLDLKYSRQPPFTDPHRVACAPDENAMYEEDANDVAILKNLLPLMSRHAAGYHPISYTVWYEYVRGEKVELHAGIDQELKSIGRLTPALTYSLYSRHLMEPAEQALVAARADLVKMMNRVHDAVQAVGSDTSHFDERLSAFQRQIAAAGTVVELSEQVSAMASEVERVGHCLGSFTDSLEKSQVEVRRLNEELDRLRQDALIDTLSGLFNRRGFDREFARMTHNTGPDASLSLIMVDIDHFKRINDQYGHPLGDAVINSVGRLVRDCVGTSGIAGRYGGEEFVVALVSHSLDQTKVLADSIRQRVEQGRIRRRQNDEAIGGITVSVGIAHSAKMENLDAMVERADQAMYRSKQDGRNRVTTESVHL
jgi:diguanylate cyclase